VDGKWNIFARGDWTTQISLNHFSKFSFARMQFLKPQSLPGEAASRKNAPDLPDGQISGGKQCANFCRIAAYARRAFCLGKADFPGPRGHVG
jgi:hypothetical protein